MRICYIASPSIHTDRWLKYFVDCGDEVHLITSVGDYESPVDKVKTHHLNRKVNYSRVLNLGVNAPSMLRQCNKLLKEINPDILHVHYIGDAAALAAASGFRPFIATAWGSDVLVEPRQSVVSKAIVKYVLAKADIVTCDGLRMADAVRSMTSPNKVHVIYHGVDTMMFAPSQKRNGSTTISTRKLERLYDVQTLVWAALDVAKRQSDARFIIAGDGSQRALLQSSVYSSKERFSFTGEVGSDELAQLMAESDIYTSTSLSDSTSVSLLEAMSCGLPVIVTDVGENSFWVKDGVNGFVIPLGGRRALSDGIQRLMRDRTMRTSMGEINRSIAVNCANLYKEMAKMREIYKGCLK